MVGQRRDPLGAGLEHLQRARVRVAALALVDDGAHAVPGDRARDEDDVAARGRAGRSLAARGIHAAQPRDPLAAEGERVDPQLQLVAALRSLLERPGAHGVPGAPTSSSSSAFCAWRRFSAWSQIRWRSP